MDQIIGNPIADTVIVTHGGFATLVISVWIGMRLDDLGYVSFRVTPGSITHLHEDDHFHNRSVESLNDTAHLPTRRA